MGWKLFLTNGDGAFFYIAIIEALIIVGFIVYLFFRRWNNNVENKDVDYKKTISKKDNEICYLRNQYYQVYNELKSLKSANNIQGDQKCKKRYVRIDFESENEAPVNEGNGYEALIRKDNQNLVKEIPNEDGTIKSEIDFKLTDREHLSDSSAEPAPIITPKKYEYLEAANGGQFRKLLTTEEKSFFRTWEENCVRKFEFHGNVEKALANINAVFDDVCEIVGKQNGATQIDNVKPGILNGQLKVEKKAIIKLT